MYALDAVELFVLMVAITVLRFGTDWPNFSRASYLIGFGIVTAIYLVFGYFGGLYDRQDRLGNHSQLAPAFRISLVAALVVAALSLGSDQFLMPRLNLAIFAVAAAAALAFNRWLARRVRTARFGRPRVLLVGTPDDIELAATHLDETDKDAEIVGRTTTLQGLATAIESCGASDVLLLSDSALQDVYPEPLGGLEQRLVGVYKRLSPADTLLGIRETRQIAGMPFVALRAHALPRSRERFKRLLDLGYLVLGLPLLIPVLLLVVGYARFVAGAPVFYRQVRVGRGAEPFVLFKIRTMYQGAEDGSGAVLAERDDPRVIPAMRWLRSTRLDELPQVWNIARGDMSLVGPRPERPELVERFEAVIPGYGRRHDIRPGLTGLAQVRGDYHTDPEYKLGHDLQYLVNWSPVTDFQLLLATCVRLTKPGS
jgi:exopolysaccharide biosynthesis polyprenyl glycosylphosphotransferase